MYEEDIVNWITARFRPYSGGVFVDVGANFGWYSCLFGRIAGDKGKVFLFEPEPKNVALLKGNLKRNGVRAYNLHEAAVGSSAGRQSLMLAHWSNPGAHSLIKSGWSSGSLQVPVVTLDETVLPKLGEDRVSLMKIDIEGFELEAIRGAPGLIERTDAIILEYSPPFLRKGGYNPLELWDGLIAKGFRAFEWRGGNEPVAVSEPPQTDQCNLLFAR
jgi:FkbM family methyltransferase